MLQNVLALAANVSSQANGGATDKLQVSLTVLLTGIVIVFTMLVFMTIVILVYSGAVRKALGRSKQKSSAASKPAEKPAPKPAPPKPAPAFQVEEGLSEEVVAVIAAAVYETYGAPVQAIRSIRRAKTSTRSAWGMAGMVENTRPF